MTTADPMIAPYWTSSRPRRQSGHEYAQGLGMLAAWIAMRVPRMARGGIQLRFSTGFRPSTMAWAHGCRTVNARVMSMYKLYHTDPAEQGESR
jgi:hypothetical protein